MQFSKRYGIIYIVRIRKPGENMNFKPNYITKDKIFEVMINKEDLQNKFLKPRESWVAENRTVNKIHVFNRNTHMLSEKSLYCDKLGYYFKGKDGSFRASPKRYRINDLIELEKE